jgi:rare lipoprotein A
MSLRLLPLLSLLTITLAAAGPMAPRATAGGGPPASAPAAPPDSIQLGIASYYADKFEGRTTASGERFLQIECTAAHPTLPFGTILRVVNLCNQREVLVRVNDRGPFTKSRIVDLSRSAAEALDMIRVGTVEVKLEILRIGPF